MDLRQQRCSLRCCNTGTAARLASGPIPSGGNVDLARRAGHCSRPRVTTPALDPQAPRARRAAQVFRSAQPARSGPARGILLDDDVVHELNQWAARSVARRRSASPPAMGVLLPRSSLVDLRLVASPDGTHAAAEYPVGGDTSRMTSACRPPRQRYRMPAPPLFALRDGPSSGSATTTTCKNGFPRSRRVESGGCHSQRRPGQAPIWIAALALASRFLFLGKRGIWIRRSPTPTSRSTCSTSGTGSIRAATRSGHGPNPTDVLADCLQRLQSSGPNAWAARLPSAVSFLV